MNKYILLFKILEHKKVSYLKFFRTTLFLIVD